MAISRHTYQVDISQSVILKKLYHYYSSLPHVDKYFLESIDSAQPYDSGHCAGFTVLAIYGTWLALLPRDVMRQGISQDDYAWFEQCMIQISSANNIALLNVRGEIDRFFGIVRYFQSPYLTLHLQAEVEAVITDTSHRRFVAEYKLIGVFSAVALAKPICIYDNKFSVQMAVLNVVAQHHKMVIIMSELHVSGLIRHYHRYYYYDANSKKGRVSYFDVHRLSQHIMESHFDKNKIGVLRFCVIDVDTAVKGRYPSQRSLLSALYSVFPLSSEVYLPYKLMALNLSALSASVESVRFYGEMLFLSSESTNQSVCLLDEYGFTNLHYAASSGCVDSVELMMKWGMPVDIFDRYQTTPLLMATFMNRVAVVKYLLDAGANPNQGTKAGFTCLFLALSKRYVELVEVLLSSSRLVVSFDEYERMCSLLKEDPANVIIQRIKQRILNRDVQADDKVFELIQKETAPPASIVNHQEGQQAGRQMVCNHHSLFLFKPSEHPVRGALHDRLFKRPGG